MEQENKKFFKGKKILITGSAGSIGSEILRNILKFEPASLRCLDINENGQFELKHQIGLPDQVAFLIGDIRDKDRIIMAMEDIDIVFHAAALKQVPLCEYNPFEAVKTNIIGTQNVIDAALHARVEKMITISTDKAVNPVNVMGATKLLGERLTISANSYKGKRKTVFSCVRFGNVLDSNGSIIPILKKQIKKGGPVTITDNGMTRFVMSIPKAIELVLEATRKARGGDIFILKMPIMKIQDLADVMVEELAPKYGFEPKEIKRKMIGMRFGEKLFEELMTPNECKSMEESDKMFTIHSMERLIGIIHETKDKAGKINETNTKAVNKECSYDSKTGHILTKEEIKALLKEVNVF